MYVFQNVFDPVRSVAELERAQKQQQEKWMDEMMQAEIQAFDAAFQKLVDEGIFKKLVIFDLKSPIFMK